MTAWGGWTPENTAEAERLYADGYSASQIAKKIGAVSRNAVISKLHRKRATRSPSAKAVSMSLGGINGSRPIKTTPAKPKLKLAGGGAVFEEPEPRAPVVQVRFPEKAPGLGHRIVDPGFGGCRWPISGEGVDTRFCCAKRPAEAVYCEEHFSLSISRADGAKPKPNDLMRSLRRYA